jgi:citrate lyase subunit beta/citryl-CoA lyase
MDAYRSLLFVPGHHPEWVPKAVRSGADAVILDLEDSVPDAAKNRARADVVASIEWLRSNHPGVGVLLRPNPLDTVHFAEDVRAVVQRGLDGFLLPKIFDRDDVVMFHALTTAAELGSGLEVGAVALVPTLETAKSVSVCEALAGAPRVASLLSSTTRDGDISREVGFSWTPEGLETIYLRSRAVLACRSAGLRHPLCGLWQEIQDLDGLAAFAAQNARLGFAGQVVIHPSHVPVVNAAYTPSADSIARYRQLVAAYEDGALAGSGAVVFNGEHIDIAHYRSAQLAIARFDSFTDRASR